MEQEKLLAINNLSIEFGNGNDVFKAVNNLSFTVSKGETVGIVGESGSGKSVSSLSIMRLLAEPPAKISSGEIIFQSAEKGEIDICKIDLENLRSIRGKEIAMIFQEPMTSLNPVLTCGYQVAEAILQHHKISKKEAKTKVLQLFDEVQLPRPEQMFDAYPHQLSGGQKQRVMIAMAISNNPSLLIADEPTTALDVTVQKTILELLKSLQQKHKMGMIFITHDLGVISEIADKIVVMYRGNVVEYGTVNDILKNPQHPYTKGLLACRPNMDYRLRNLPTVADFMKNDSEGNIVSTEKDLHKTLASEIIPENEIVAERAKLYQQEALLKVEDLKTWFPIKKGFFRKTVDYVKAVNNVSFEVFPGETLGLVGESGCGKSTLGRTILRLIEPTSGKVFFRGKNVAELGHEEMRLMRKDLQIVFQDPYSSLNPKMTIGDAILEPMEVHNIYQNKAERKEKVLELLEKVGLQKSHYNRYPHEFSGGQRQRICIARTLSLNPKFIICDESVSALDVSVQAQVLNLLNQLKREFGFTYIFISHDLSVVKFMSDRMIVMSKGEIEEIGFPEEIYKNPKSEYTKRLINAIPKV